MIIRIFLSICIASSLFFIIGCANNTKLSANKKQQVKPLMLTLKPMSFQLCNCPKKKDFNQHKIDSIAVITFVNLEEKNNSTSVMPCGRREKYKKFTYLNNPGDFIAGLSEKIILESYKFDVIERRHLRDLLKEHHLNLTGIIKPADVKEIGKITGVDALLLGEIYTANSGLLGTWRGGACIFTPTATIDVSLRLVDVETAKILWICSVHRTSLNYLKEPFSITAEEAIKDMSKIRRALQGRDSDMNPIRYVAKNALYEAFETLLSN